MELKKLSSRSGAFAEICKLDEELTAWVWATYEQEKFWLKTDAAWVEQAEKDWHDDAELSEMLRSYSLLRGVRGKLLSGANSSNRLRFAELAKIQSSKLKDGESDYNTAVWRDFGTLFADHCKLSSDGWFMPSATLKMMWFYQPKMVPMYDRLAAEGLNELAPPKERNNHRADFLKRAYDFLEIKREIIRDAKEILDSPYPYDVRILDKYLWLMGNSDKTDIIARFRTGCARLALSPIL